MIKKLLEPQVNEGVTVKQAISRRHTSRDFSTEPLSDKNLSEILWAAYGVNGAENHRTVPSACGIYPLSVYAFLPDGVYLYNPIENTLTLKVEGDHRDKAGMQDFVAQAPLSLVMMTDFSKFKTGNPTFDPLLEGNEMKYSLLDAGAVTENVYLYCTCAGINVVERGMADEKTLKDLLQLPDNYHLVVSMTVGYPPES